MTPTFRTRCRILSLILLACAVTACNRQDLELPDSAQSGEARQRQNNDGRDPFVVSSDGAFVGAEVDEKGEVLNPQHTFSPDTTVFVSVPSEGRSPGDRIELFWFHEDGRSRNQEAKKIDGPFTAFEFRPSEVGKYNVEVDVNNRPVALVEFEVR